MWNTPFICKNVEFVICNQNKIFPILITLKIKTSGDEKTLTCGICGSTQKTKKDYDRHISGHHRKKKCKICQISVCAFELKATFCLKLS